MQELTALRKEAATHKKEVHRLVEEKKQLHEALNRALQLARENDDRAKRGQRWRDMPAYEVHTLLWRRWLKMDYIPVIDAP